MIPSTNNKLLVAEDWKKVYQSFKNADFKSYDFDTLRRVMIQYLRENYPEDFNDYVDSSEYIALVDLIAYLGQNLSFRIDLNARENFLETASRRDSILRLASLISYNAKRNIPANGFLKITAVTTTDNVIDANGVNLANSVVAWNDPTNTNWYQQFISIMNSAMPSGFTFGKPYNKAVIDGVTTEEYRVNTNNTDVPLFNFSKSINGTSMNFEIVSSTFAETNYIYEDPPQPGNSFSCLFKNDNRGAGSANTGFFVHFRQGTLNYSDFTVDNPVANELVGINAPDINNTDVWLWQQGSSGKYDILWTKVDSTTGNNVIYNSLNNDIRNVYAVTSRDGDQIDLNFADGSFGNLPKGNFRLFYRQSNGVSYSIPPEQVSGISVKVPYYNKNGQLNTLNMILSLQYTVDNSQGAESNSSIKTKAPQAYYLQNRMITGEDYQIGPVTAGTNILKVKSINRMSSGISKYFELSDITGKYSRTNIFATDGIIYKEESLGNMSFQFTSRNEFFGVLKSQIEPTVLSPGFKNFYLDKYIRPTLTNLNLRWVSVNKTKTQTRGYFVDYNGNPVQLGYFSSNNAQYVVAGALIKFLPPTGFLFKAGGGFVTTAKADATASSYKWVKISQVVGDGANSGKGPLNDGTGPVILTGRIDEGAIPAEVIPVFVTTLSYALENQMVNLGLIYQNFGLSFDKTTRQWFVIVNTNLDLKSPFNLIFQGDSTNSNKDASWMIAFQWTGQGYTVYYRTLDYLFESKEQTAFYVDSSKQNFDFITGTVVKDQINVLGINNSPDVSTYSALGLDYRWQVDTNIIDPDGYTEPRKVKISFYDAKNDGQIEDPDAFINIVNPDYVSPTTTSLANFVYFQRLADGLRYKIADIDIIAYPDSSYVTDLLDGQYFYFYTADVVKYWSDAVKDFVLDPSYFAKIGRSNLKFHYEHNSGEDRRIDPAKTNIIDIYMLTSTYDTLYRNWLTTGAGAAPIAPTTNSLEESYSPLLEPIKSISDTLIYHPAKYKVLFGPTATLNLQATFKAVKNSSSSMSDNQIKTAILSAINQFFAIENWEFGQSFNFGELSTYVMNIMTPDIVNFVLVPKSNIVFGSLFEVASQSDEIFISGATISDIEVIDSLTASQINTTASIVINTVGM
jgi:hypothetical protein